MIEFDQPKSLIVNCDSLIDFEIENSLRIYRGIELSSNEILLVYEWKISLEKNSIYEKKKLDFCLARVNFQLLTTILLKNTYHILINVYLFLRIFVSFFKNVKNFAFLFPSFDDYDH